MQQGLSNSTPKAVADYKYRQKVCLVHYNLYPLGIQIATKSMGQIISILFKLSNFVQ